MISVRARSVSLRACCVSPYKGIRVLQQLCGSEFIHFRNGRSFYTKSAAAAACAYEAGAMSGVEQADFLKVPGLAEELVVDSHVHSLSNRSL